MVEGLLGSVRCEKTVELSIKKVQSTNMKRFILGSSEGANNLTKIPINIQGTMEHSQNVDVAVGFDQVSNSIMTVEKDSDLTKARRLVAVSDLGMLLQQKRLLIDTADRLCSSVGIIRRNVVVDLF